MGRKKVKHELIPNESTRKVTFRKRKAGLLKKLSELTTLCGIPACAVIYSNYSEQPEIWPNEEEVYKVLERLKKLPSEKQGKYMLDQKKFLRQTITKMSQDLEKERRKNHVLELGLLAAGFFPGQDLDHIDYSEELFDALCCLDNKIKSVDSRLENVEKGEPSNTKDENGVPLENKDDENPDPAEEELYSSDSNDEPGEPSGPEEVNEAGDASSSGK